MTPQRLVLEFIGEAPRGPVLCESAIVDSVPAFQDVHQTGSRPEPPSVLDSDERVGYVEAKRVGRFPSAERD